jgi:tetratricopeptide (TPR) repeat protein
MERIKGNESFRTSENEEALRCYTNSIAYDCNNAVVFANRAMAYIRLQVFDLAEEDSTVSLSLDPTYVKAYSRRGLVRFKRGKYLEVINLNKCRK